MAGQQGPPPGGPAGPAVTDEAVRWAGHPFTGTPAEARARLAAAGERAASQGLRPGGHPRRPGPKVPGAAVVVLTAAPPDRGNVSARTQPAVVRDIDGDMVAVWHDGTLDGPVTGAWCACGNRDGPDGPCEHVLVALAGTRQPQAR
jgi:hypothetical protein